MVVKAHAVHNGALLGRAKQARLRVARLRARRYRADFNKPKAQRRQAVYRLAVFVQACRQPNGIGQLQAHQRSGLGVRVYARHQAIGVGKGLNGEIVRLLGIKFEQQRTDKS